MTDKQLTIEDVIRQMNDMMNDASQPTKSPTKMYINASQMAIVRQMMDAGALSNHPPSRHIYEPEETNEVPKVQQSDHGK